MRNKKRNRILFLLILLLGIGIGFAALATTLKINGSATITKNTWNIYWDNVANETGVTPTSETEILNEDTNHQKNIVSFTVTLDQPGDFYEFEVDAVNAGTLDAEIISIAKKYNGTVIPEVEDPNNRVVPAYLKYEVTYADTGAPAVGDKLAKRTDATHFTTKTYKIRVEYDRNAVTNSDINGQVGDVECTFTLEVEYGQATPAPAVILPEGKTASTLALGDEIEIGGEYFNFVKYDNSGDAVFLAKWNLKVGKILTNGAGTYGEYSSSDPGFGLQASEARGGIFVNDLASGNIEFSQTNYWDDNNSPKNDYPGAYYINNSSPFPEHFPSVYDENYDGNYGTQTYSIAKYVKSYKQVLEGMGATIKEARLLTFEEVTGQEFGCTWVDYDSLCSPATNGEFISNTTFWLGSAYRQNDIWHVSIYEGNSLLSPYQYSYEDGIRPVIVIEQGNL